MARKPFIEWSSFEKLDIRTGTIKDVRPFEKARKAAYKMTIDFGDLGELKTSAQITDLYSLESLIGKQIIAIVNFRPKQIADFMSECLVLGVYTDEGVVILETERTTKNGQNVG